MTYAWQYANYAQGSQIQGIEISRCILIYMVIYTTGLKLNLNLTLRPQDPQGSPGLKVKFKSRSEYRHAYTYAWQYLDWLPAKSVSCWVTKLG